MKKFNKIINFLEEKKKLICYVLCVAIVFSLGMLTNSLDLIEKFKEKREYLKYEDQIISTYEKSINVSRDKYSQSGKEKKYVDGFDPLVHTFRFKNFGSENSKGGNCEGISVYELMNFNGKKEDLSKYKLSESDIEKLYEDKSQYAVFKDDNSNGEKVEINYEGVIKKAFGFSKIDNNESDIYYTEETKLDNKDTDNIIKELVRIQSNKIEGIIHSRFVSGYYYPPEASLLDEYVDEGYMENKRSINPIVIKDKIDNNELAIIGVTNNAMGGHALLVYGYEVIDENNIKFYVCDSNYPIKPGYEKEYMENISILFTKDVDGENWGYIYSPTIESNEVITFFNSFIPGTNLYVYY
ncbi:MAG: hypothetical protein SOX50_02415 [Terrisporobacter othiniensis]|uniref:hypothetical protein n=1 Tax=Terrisporobacter othiniensis TaxID=1577792 RepID=UPI002A752D72|nr:hypothetical protein [Terrisporobacter othiniensis]MDY3372113.1 hypothetical protein [Terrisporobacter othiniensis]